MALKGQELFKKISKFKIILWKKPGELVDMLGLFHVLLGYNWCRLFENFGVIKSIPPRPTCPGWLRGEFVKPFAPLINDPSHFGGKKCKV